MKTLFISLAFSYIFLSEKSIAVSKKEDPKTVSESIADIKTIFAQLHLKFREGVTDEQIIFGLQHTLADQRQTGQGRKFPITPDYLLKVVNYYKAMCNTILDNQVDVELTLLYVNTLSDLTISESESLFLSQTEIEIQKKYRLDTRSYYKFDNRGNNPSEVNTDPMLLSKDKDGMNEGLGFEIAGTDKIFLKQYLASLLEPIK